MIYILSPDRLAEIEYRASTLQPINSTLDDLSWCQAVISELAGEIHRLRQTLQDDPTGYWQAALAAEKKRANDNLRLAAERAAEINELRRQLRVKALEADDEKDEFPR